MSVASQIMLLLGGGGSNVDAAYTVVSVASVLELVVCVALMINSSALSCAPINVDKDAKPKIADADDRKLAAPDMLRHLSRTTHSKSIVDSPELGVLSLGPTSVCSELNHLRSLIELVCSSRTLERNSCDGIVTHIAKRRHATLFNLTIRKKNGTEKTPKDRILFCCFLRHAHDFFCFGAYMFRSRPSFHFLPTFFLMNRTI